MKSYTSLEQSKKLAEFLPLGTADYWYAPDADVVMTSSYITKADDETLVPAYKGAIPCWSLSALLDVLPYSQLSKDKLGSCKVGYMVSAYPDNCRQDSCWHDNPIDACYEMVVRLHKLNLL